MRNAASNDIVHVLIDSNFLISTVYVCMWLIHIICFCLPFLFVFFLLPFFCILPYLLFLLLSLTFQNIGPATFPGLSRRKRPNLGLVCFVLMFAVFLVKDACVCYVVVDLVLVL